MTYQPTMYVLTSGLLINRQGFSDTIHTELPTYVETQMLVFLKPVLIWRKTLSFSL